MHPWKLQQWHWFLDQTPKINNSDWETSRSCPKRPIVTENCCLVDFSSSDQVSVNVCLPRHFSKKERICDPCQRVVARQIMMSGNCDNTWTRGWSRDSSKTWTRDWTRSWSKTWADSWTDYWYSTWCNTRTYNRSNNEAGARLVPEVRARLGPTLGVAHGVGLVPTLGATIRPRFTRTHTRIGIFNQCGSLIIGCHPMWFLARFEIH